MRIFRLHLVLTFPSKLRATFGFPTNLDQMNPFVLQLPECTVHYLHRFLDKMQCFINTYFVKRYVEVLVS
ncbi:hypothetical protein HanXRQr2_Chr17g0815161 [Helianthus annuus]|uniref:Uncharacterized protein n=1 Tax=Helianthus annuus TaxID=4232 RepID=A0A9K3DJA7_HELAN|nr:hypothetical protein HanXRQr2_Chr17g0815161 [Helianthus annuus]KAJ0814202.1 hypothetical protein HanPSC8_Chr17g0782821 [Helianthus annuus]